MQTLVCQSFEEVNAAFSMMPEWQANGYVIAVALSYALGQYWVPNVVLTHGGPLAIFHVYRSYQWWAPHQMHEFLVPHMNEKPVHLEYAFEYDKAEYCKRINHLKAHLANGDSYIINFTQLQTGRFSCSGLPLYAHLRQLQRVPFGAYFPMVDRSLMSFSPELFFKKEGATLTTQPMKGTSPRGGTHTEDRALQQWLVSDPKNRAENTIVVDLLRNDCAKIAKPGTVEVPSLLDVEAFDTVLQMTSTITAEVEKNIPLSEFLSALFPCGSITGAPKSRTMQLIEQYEASPRGFYTGALGYVLPNNDMCFNVAIRTLEVDEQGAYQYGVGSGIVIDSDPALEYEECSVKAAFLDRQPKHFNCIDSLYWSSETGFRHVGQHMTRLSASCEYFCFPFSHEHCIAHMHQAVEGLQGEYKVRVSITALGEYEVETIPLKEIECLPIVVLANSILDSKNPHVLNKTSVRAHYDDAYRARYAETQCMDVLFLNEKGQVAEGSYNNVFIEKAGVWYTPPCEVGCLNGIGRECLLADECKDVQEKVLMLDDLRTADQIYVVNDIRGIRPVSFVEDA